MALRFLDSFDSYGSTHLVSRWTSVNSALVVTPTIAAGGRTANSLRWTTASTNVQMNSVTLTPQIGVSGATAIVGCALKITDLSGLSNGVYGAFLTIFEGTTAKFGYRLNQDGTWSCGTGDGPSTYTSSGVPIQDDTWAYVEFKTVLHDSTGSATIRVNGTTVLEETNIDTIKSGSAAWSSITLFSSGYSQTLSAPALTTVTIDLDDFYLLDGTTGTGRANDDFWGDTTVRYRPPTADTATRDWGRSAGVDNYALVAEGGSVPQTPDEDSTYVTTDTVDATDLYDADPVTTGADVTGVQVILRARKGDTGAASVAGVIKSGGTTEEHPAPLGVASDSAYNYYLFPWDGDPNAGPGAWTESALNAATFGPRKTA